MVSKSIQQIKFSLQDLDAKSLVWHVLNLSVTVCFE